MIVLKDLTLVERANAQVVGGKWGETSAIFKFAECAVFFVFAGRQFIQLLFDAVSEGLRSCRRLAERW